MFQRRTPKSVLLKFKNLIWPCMGWFRLLHYYQHRVGRMRGSPEMIAAGFASGVAVSFTPLMGFHFILGLLIALVVRGSLVASILGTLFGNPWTFPIIWLLIYKLGLFMMYGHATGTEAMTELSFKYLFYNLADVFWIMMLGSIPFVIVTWVLVYYIMLGVITRYKKRRKYRLARKMMKDFKGRAK